MGAMIIVGTVIVVGIAMVIIMIGMGSAMCIIMTLVVMFSRCGATSLTEEREVGHSRHVRRGHEGADQRNVVEELVAVMAGVIDDLVLREEPRKERETAQRSG